MGDGKGDEDEKGFREDLRKYLPGILEGWSGKKRTPASPAELVALLDGFPSPPWPPGEVQDSLYSLRSQVCNSPHTPDLDSAVFRFIDKHGGPRNREPLPIQNMAEWLAKSDAWQLDAELIAALRDHPHEGNVNVFAYMLRGTRREIAGVPFKILVEELRSLRMAWSPKQTLIYMADQLKREQPEGGRPTRG